MLFFSCSGFLADQRRALVSHLGSLFSSLSTVLQTATVIMKIEEVQSTTKTQRIASHTQILVGATRAAHTVRNQW